jgi:hypothetical protein
MDQGTIDGGFTVIGERDCPRAHDVKAIGQIIVYALPLHRDYLNVSDALYICSGKLQCQNVGIFLLGPNLEARGGGGNQTISNNKSAL